MEKTVQQKLEEARALMHRAEGALDAAKDSGIEEIIQAAEPAMAQAKEVVEQLDPRIVIPMHYRTEYNADWPIDPVEEFTKLFDPAQVRTGGQALRVTRGDLNCHPRIVVLGK